MSGSRRQAAPVTLVWFHRDLRLADHPALDAAVRRGSVVCLYIHDPDAFGAWPPGEASNWWLHHSLDALDAELRQRGAKLHLAAGRSADVLDEWLAAPGVDAVFFTQRQEPALRARDARIADSLAERGVDCKPFPGRLLHAPWDVLTGKGDPYRVFTPFWKRLQANFDAAPPLRVDSPASLKACNDAPSGLALDDLELLPSLDWADGLAEVWRPGSDGAHEALDQFLDDAAGRYEQGRNRPDQRGTSCLSPHLHFGEISPSTVWHAVAEQRALGGGSANSLTSYLSEIAWREFAHHLLWHFPDTTDAPMDQRFAAFDWRDPETDERAADDLRRWQCGETGIDMVDAGMRELWATGWMHNRVRMIVASFLTKNLRIHWLHGARWFWDTLVDADLASNTLGWQWTAGCGADAAPFFRVFNPDLQAEKFDPQVHYRTRWLAERPAGLEPIVDLKASRRRALEAFDAIKRRDR